MTGKLRPITSPKKPKAQAITGEIAFTDTATGRRQLGAVTFTLTPQNQVRLDSITLTSQDTDGLQPGDFRNVSKVLPEAMQQLISQLLGMDLGELSQKLAEGLTERQPGELKGQWIARLWREHYQPTGRTMKQLAADLGLGHNTVRTYCSDYDPTKGSN